MRRGNPVEVLPANVQPGQQGEGDDAPRRVGGEHAQDDPHVPVHERPAGRPGGRVVADARPLHLPPVPRGRGVVECEREAGGTRHERLDDLVSEAGGHPVGPPPGGRDRGVARAVLVAQPGDPDAAGHRPPAAGEDGPDQQPSEPRGEQGVEGGGEARENQWHGGGGDAKMLWAVPSGASVV